MSERTKFGKSITKTKHFWQHYARTHEKVMSNVCTDDASIDKGKRATSSGLQQIISKHNKSRFYLYPALIKGEQK